MCLYFRITSEFDVSQMFPSQLTLYVSMHIVLRQFLRFSIELLILDRNETTQTPEIHT